MRYSVTLIALVLFLVVMSLGTGYYVVQYQSLFFAAICVLAAVSAALLVLRGKTVRYPFFATAALIAYWWISTVVAIIREGWPYMDPISSAVSLIPGALLLTVCAVGSLYVYRITKHAAA